MKEIICESCGRLEVVGDAFFKNNIDVSINNFMCECKGKFVKYIKEKLDYSLFL